MERKLKLLCWSDAATAGTGFGTVSRHVLKGLHDTGKYDIHHLAINFRGEFLNQDDIPWQVQPAALLEGPNDPHGMKMFAKALMTGNYDIVWISNDVHVTHLVYPIIEKCREQSRAKGIKPPIFVYYYPVDCNVPLNESGMLDVVDVPVCYSDHGRFETLNTKPYLYNKLRQIPCGVDTDVFKPIAAQERNHWRKQYFDIGPDTTMVINVNRNTTRKQASYSVAAFKEFKELVPDSLMYLHMAERDQGGDLRKIIESMGLSLKTDVVIPAKFSVSNPLPAEVLNRIYNCGDMYLSTHLGEGWGLTITEALAAGTPVVTGDNTCMTEQLGENSERGYLYPCKDQICIDTQGFRKKGLIPDIVEAMCSCFHDRQDGNNTRRINAHQWAAEHDWKNIQNKWIDLFEYAITLRDKAVTEVQQPSIEEI